MNEEDVYERLYEQGSDEMVDVVDFIGCQTPARKEEKDILGCRLSKMANNLWRCKNCSLKEECDKLKPKKAR